MTTALLAEVLHLNACGEKAETPRRLEYEFVFRNGKRIGVMPLITLRINPTPATIISLQ